MTNWKKVNSNSNLIKGYSTNGVLIKIPNEEWLFWHPSKLVRTSGKANYLLTISFTEDFNFKLFKNGKGKTNKFEKIDEMEVDASEFESYF